MLTAILLVPTLVQAQGGSDGNPRPTSSPFVVESAGGDHRLQLTFLLQVDGRFYPRDEGDAVTNAFVVRRLRPILQGRLARHFEFLFTPDLAAGSVNIRDAYVDTRFSHAFRLRFGKAKVPFGLERLHAAASLLLAERALPTRVAPDRDVGVHLLGDLFEGRLSYHGAIINGGPDGAAVNTDTNDAKDIVGRVVVHPWAAHVGHPLTGLGVALAGSQGQQTTELPSFRSSGFQVFFAYAADAEGTGHRRRVSPQTFYYRGPFGAFGEYVRSSGGVRRGATSADIDHVAWQAAASWVLTGEAATHRGVRPRYDFDPENHHWGAIQVAGRYHELAIDTEGVMRGFAAPGSSRAARGAAQGVNWYLNPFVHWVLSVERTVFDDGAPGARPAEHLLIVRGQIAF